MERRDKQKSFQMGKREASIKKNTDGQKAHQKSSTLLIIKYMQIKTTIRYHIQVGAHHKEHNQFQQHGCEEKGILIQCWWEYRLIQSFWQIIWLFLKKLDIEVLYNFKIRFLEIYSQDLKTKCRKETCTPMFVVSLLTIARIWKQPKCPRTGDWIKK